MTMTGVTCPRQILRGTQTESNGGIWLHPSSSELEISKGVLSGILLCAVFNLKDIIVLEEIQRRIIKPLWGCLTKVG